MHKSLGVYEQVVAQDVILESIHEPPGLHGQARTALRCELVATRSPFHPVHDSARHRVRLPTDAVAGRILNDPPIEQRFVPTDTMFAAFGIQIVEIVEVIYPELGDVRRLPISRCRDATPLVEKKEDVRPDHARIRRDGRCIRPRPGADSGRRTKIRPRSPEFEHGPPDELCRQQVAERVEVAS